MRDLVKSAFSLLSDARLDALQLAGNALLLAAAALWLLIPEARVSQLVFAAVSALSILFLFAWLHCGTLAHGVTPAHETLGADVRRALRHVPVFLVLLLVMAWTMSRVAALSDQSWQISGYLFTRLPQALRNSIGTYRLNGWVEGKIVAATWILLPAIFLPWLTAVAAFGLRRRAFGPALRTYACWTYWIGVAAAGFFGVWVPRMLIGWTPGHGLRKEALSMGLRLLLAYVLAVAAWLLASGIAGRLLRDAIPVQDAAGQSLA